MAPVRNTQSATEKDTQAAATGASATDKQRRKPGRVPVSCAECRRLKLRCDRQVPCESCTKRGCAALCPDGSLPTTKGPKLKAAAEVEELREKVAQLEAALATMQAAISDEPHPLLKDSNTPPTFSQDSPGGVPPSSSSGASSSPPAVSQEEEDEVLDSFGTLTLGNRGEARFFGQTSRTEYLIHAPERLKPFTDNVKFPRITQITLDEACKELDVFCTSMAVGEEVLSCIPPMEEALRLCEIYFDCSKFLWYPLPREYVYTEIVAAIYQQPKPGEDYCHVSRKHAMSLLFMIFSLATLFDQSMPPYSSEAQEYYLLSRICLRWAPPTYDTTLAAIQTLLYMAQYLEMSDCEPAHTASHKAWMQTRHAVSLGYSIGLHVSGCKWQLDSTASAKRGRVFWQLFTQDTWLSFGFGRPPSISLSFVDCEIPQPEEITSVDGSRWSTGFHVWTWQFTKLMHTIMNDAFAAKSPTYAKIMDLDKRVRDFPDPPCLRDPSTTGAPGEDVTRIMQTMSVSLYKETTHLNLHRPYLSQALKDMPEDPLRHKYGASVMVIYRSAWRIINSVEQAYKAAPGIMSRMSLQWSQSLACAIILCLLITRAPTAPMAKSSLAELDKICNIFENAAGQCQIASNNILVLRKLRKQAHDAIGQVADTDTATVNAELDRLGGKTQLIQTIGERVAYCGSYAGRALYATLEKGLFPPSVFEAQSNPNGVLQPTVARDPRPMEDPGAFGGSSLATSAASGANAGGPGGRRDIYDLVTSMEDIEQMRQPQPQDFDWIAGFLSSTGTGTAVGGMDAQMAAAGVPPPGNEPVPSAAELDANWQSLVDQLGI